jgi:hypothetical protein
MLKNPTQTMKRLKTRFSKIPLRYKTFTAVLSTPPKRRYTQSPAATPSFGKGFGLIWNDF